ncbi:MAG: SDR family NAD(P)-dependent oxidoreductase [Phycisphaerales bacterium]|nr:SDR family NAD(P)-dependent oxidoreductase [Phycisphaerales bacterium]
MIKLPAETVSALRPVYDGRHVCVTGGAGFIGGHLVDALHALGASVSVIDDLSNSNAAHVAELLEFEPDRLKFIHGSILDERALAEAADEASVVFHLAAVGSVQRSIAQPQRTWTVNATGTLRVLEAAQAARAKRVVLATSSSAYGDTEKLPKHEAMTPRPLSPYAASKVAAETLAGAWSRAYRLDTVCLRYFNVYGPRQSAESEYAAVIPAFAKRLLTGRRPIIYGDGQRSRDFTFVTNAVLATLLAGAKDQPLAGLVLNVGTGKRTTILELAEQMAALAIEGDEAGVAAEPEHRAERPGDIRDSLADIALARKVLGYEPLVGFRQGLADTLAWCRADLASTGGG